MICIQRKVPRFYTNMKSTRKPIDWPFEIGDQNKLIISRIKLMIENKRSKQRHNSEVQPIVVGDPVTKVDQ